LRYGYSSVHFISLTQLETLTAALTSPLCIFSPAPPLSIYPTFSFSLGNLNNYIDLSEFQTSYEEEESIRQHRYSILITFFDNVLSLFYSMCISHSVLMVLMLYRIPNILQAEDW
jgi:hypothetical protein